MEVSGSTCPFAFRVGLFILYKDWEKKRNFEASYLEWEISRLMQSGEEEKAKKLIEEGLKRGCL